MMKIWHDWYILHCIFNPSSKVLLYDLGLCQFPGKLHPRWTGSFIVKTIYPYGAIANKNPKIDPVFKVNGKWLNHLLEFLKKQGGIPCLGGSSDISITYIRKWHYVYYAYYFAKTLYFCSLMHIKLENEEIS